MPHIKIKGTLKRFLDGNFKDYQFAPHRELSQAKRARCADSARSLVEEVLQSIPTNADKSRISDGEARFLCSLFEQVILDLDDVPEDDVEGWRRARIDGLYKIISLVHGLMISNSRLY